MKKSAFIWMLACVLCTFFLAISSPEAYAQSKEPLIPGITCGVADSTDATACCMSEDEIPEEEGAGFLEKAADKVPGLGFIANALERKRNFQNSLNATLRENANETKCITGEPTLTNPRLPQCKCVDSKTVEAGAVAKMCKKYIVSDADKNVEEERLTCVKCAQEKGYWSSLGCIPLSLGDLVSQVILTVGIGLGGFIAVLCITINALRMQVSQGDSGAVQKARENITSCILGLILILFSVFILRIVDYTIFGGIL